MNRLCTICVRGGSKGVPGKNARLISGKPLIAHTIEQALQSKLFDHVVLSTDSKNLATIAKEYGASVWFLRPDYLATDSAAKIPVIRHALLESEEYFNKKFDVHIDLDATSPLRNVSDIINAYEQFIDERADILITGSPARKNPYFNMVEYSDGKLNIVKALPDSLVCRQDAPVVYDMNASIYIWKRDVLLNSDSLFSGQTAFYCMPEIRSIDIDTDADFYVVEALMQLKKKQVTLSAEGKI